MLMIGLTLQQIMDVDEKNQILTTNIWLNLVRVKESLICTKSHNVFLSDIIFQI